jgi:HEAT repeat protein
MAIPSGRSGRFIHGVLAAIAGASLLAQAPAPAGGDRGPQAIAPEALQAAIAALGNLDFNTRMNAARTVRRAPADVVVPALIRAAESHADGFVRFRALVLMTGFEDPRTRDVMRKVVSDPNDRLRTVAYAFYEHHPDAAALPLLLKALDREESEFVRPALIRALAAQGGDGRVRDTLLVEVGRGQDYFRSTVIEALGDYRIAYGIQPLIGIARLDGPLQIDAAIALGKLGNQVAMETLASLQRTAPRDSQPPIAAAICLLGINCGAHVGYLIDTLRFADRNPGFQALLRNTVAGTVALSNSGNAQALSTLFDVGIPSQDPPRAPMAIGVATVALRNIPLVQSFLEGYADRDGAIALLAEGFDILEEDYEEERFFAAVRQAYWEAPDGSASRRVAQALIEKLEF